MTPFSYSYSFSFAYSYSFSLSLSFSLSYSCWDKLFTVLCSECCAFSPAGRGYGRWGNRWGAWLLGVRDRRWAQPLMVWYAYDFFFIFLNLSMAFSKRTVKSKLLSFHNILLVLSGAGKVSVYIITGRKQKVFPLFSQPYENRVIVEKSVDNLWTTVENLQNRNAVPYGVAPISVYRSADRIDN